MKKRLSGSPISRYQIFTLADGTFVVQWGEMRVQELLTGQYRDFDYKRDFGHAITNYELAQLRASGRVEYFNRHYVWMYPLPEAGRFGQRRVLGRGDKVRAYYLVTDFPRMQIDLVQSVLETLQLDHVYTAKSRDNTVVLLDKNGLPFGTLAEAEKAQEQIKDKSPDAFTNLAVAFIETSPNSTMPKPLKSNDNTKLDLEEIIASQTETDQFTGKNVLLALKEQDEREAFGSLLDDMHLQVMHTETASEALQTLEDDHVDLFVMDIQLSGAQGGWPFINRIREIEQLRNLPIVLIGDQQNFSVKVAKVEYLVRPVSIARFRHNIWVILHNGEEETHIED